MIDRSLGFIFRTDFRFGWLRSNKTPYYNEEDGLPNLIKINMDNDKLLLADTLLLLRLPECISLEHNYIYIVDQDLDATLVVLFRVKFLKKIMSINVSHPKAN